MLCGRIQPIGVRFVVQVDDLLEPSSQNLKVRPDQQTKLGWYVEGLEWVTCSDPEGLMHCFDVGRKHLKYAETHMNKHSSRSHAVMQAST